MYNPLLDTLITVAECGSFLKASEKLYISPTAIMKQMNQLESHIGLPLFVRTSKGVALTAAGNSVYKDAKQLVIQSQEAVWRAYQAEKIDQIFIRLGTSALYPCKTFMDLWNTARDQHPRFKLQVVPFEDCGMEKAFANVGKKYDVITGPFDSAYAARFSRFLELGRYHFCISMPWGHRLSQKESLSYKDLHGEKLMIQEAGNSPANCSPANDRIRAEIKREHPEITILDVPCRYDPEMINKYSKEGCLRLSLENQEDIHPALVSVPLMTAHTIPYGMIYSAKASQETRHFLQIIQKTLVGAALQKGGL